MSAETTMRSVFRVILDHDAMFDGRQSSTWATHQASKLGEVLKETSYELWVDGYWVNIRNKATGHTCGWPFTKVKRIEWEFHDPRTAKLKRQMDKTPTFTSVELVGDAFPGDEDA